MKTSIMMSVLISLILLLGLAACDDNNNVAPPEPPPQLNLKIYRTPVLPDNDVFNVFVDSQDRIWFCTSNGVGMLDGGQMTHFNQTEGLPNPVCRKAVEFNDKIWVVTWGGGVGIYNNSTWTVLNAEDGLRSNRVFDVAVDGNYIYFSTNTGVIRYDDDDQLQMSARWQNFTNKVLHKEVSSIEFAEGTTRGDELWFGSKFNWVSVWRLGTQENIHYSAALSGIPGTGVNDIAYNAAVGGDGTFWVAFGTEGVASVDVDISTWSHYTTEQGLPSMIVHSVAVAQDGVVWAGTQSGLGKWTGSRFIAFPRGSGLPEDRIRSVDVDSNNNVWLSFIEGGAAKIIR